jgi:hypothetical protein
MPDTQIGAALLEAARAFRPRIIADRDRIEASRRIPEDLAQELARAGFFRLLLPEAYGGLDLTPMAAMEVFEELAGADASVAWCVWNGNAHWTAAQLSPEAARTIHADPDVITANSTRSSGQAHIVPDGFRVSGRWSLVSGCELGTWMVLLCVVHEDGKPQLTPAGAPENRFMLIPSADCEIIDTWTVGGLRGTGSHDVLVRDVFVPDSYGSGFTDPYVLRESRYRIPHFPGSSPASAGWRSGLPEPRSTPLVRLPAPRRRSVQRKCSATLTARKCGCLRRNRSCAPPGCSCSIVWNAYGCGCSRPAKSRWRRARMLDWPHRMRFPAPYKPSISYMSGPARRRSTRAAPWNGHFAMCTRLPSISG